VHVLTILSLIYAGILILALAISLLLITLHLARIARALKAIENELSQVARSTESLSPHLELVAREVKASLSNMKRTHATLAPIVDPISRLAEKLGLTQFA
jgi:uncharacterized protein YoxC